MLITAQQITGDAGCKTETQCIIIEEGCLANFNDIMRQNGIDGKIAGLFDTNTVKATGMVIPRLHQIIVLDAENLHANEKAVEETLPQIEDDVNVIAAFGSGTVTDIARYCARQKNLVLVSCPTAASVDGFCSSVCAMTFNNTKVTVPAVAPKVVVADVNVIKNAPVRLVRSGFGDILGKYVALTDWKIANLVTGEYYSESTVRLVKQALQEVMDLVERNEFQGEEFYSKTTYALILSGLAMQIVGTSRPASGAEHHFSHFVTVVPDSTGKRTEALHGESVGVGTLAMVERYRNIANRLHLTDDAIQCAKKTLDSLRQNGNVLHGIEFYQSNFGAIAQALYDENKNDCLAKVDIDALQKNWEEIRKIIFQMPSVQELRTVYDKLQLKSTLHDLDLVDSEKERVIRLSPFIRNRLTLNRLTLLFNSGGVPMDI